MPLLTVGHGPEDRTRLGARLAAAGVGRVVDVRRFPGSRNNPDVRREALEEWLPAAGIGYRWDARLGGRRRLPPGEPVADVAVLARGVPVQHLMPDGRLAPHRPSEGAVLGDDGQVRWPAP